MTVASVPSGYIFLLRYPADAFSPFEGQEPFHPAWL